MGKPPPNPLNEGDIANNRAFTMFHRYFKLEPKTTSFLGRVPLLPVNREALGIDEILYLL